MVVANDVLGKFTSEASRMWGKKLLVTYGEFFCKLLLNDIYHLLKIGNQCFFRKLGIRVLLNKKEKERADEWRGVVEYLTYMT